MYLLSRIKQWINKVIAIFIQDILSLTVFSEKGRITSCHVCYTILLVAQDNKVKVKQNHEDWVSVKIL